MTREALTPGLRDRDVPAALPALGAGVSPLLARLYAARGVEGPSDIDYRLATLPHPVGLSGLAAASAVMADAIMRGQRLLVVGDFDADGATSTALAVRALMALGATRVDYLVPNRFEFGYGLSAELVAVARERSPDLILTVDNGISAHAGVDAANAAGIPVVVTDHHLPGATLPEAAAIVNPQLDTQGFAGRSLAGVGVCFYLMLGIRSALREQGWFGPQRAEPALVEQLDLVALGTVADVVPMDSVNRTLVEQGLRRIRAGEGTPGVAALLEAAGRDPADCIASDLGFAAGPRLNAAGRLGDMGIGIELLLCDSATQARDRAAELDALNRERRTLEQSMREEALAGIEADTLADPDDPAPVLCLYREDWHQGVVGIVASRIKERFQRPVIAFAPGEAGQLKGSGRSVSGVHLRDLLEAIDTRTDGRLIQRFGGHAMAAGLSIRPDDYAAFRDELQAIAREQLGERPLGEVIDTDGELTANAYTLTTARAIRYAGPWGPGFPEPCFRGRFRVAGQRVVGSHHLKLSLVPEGEATPPLDAIAFNALEQGWDVHTAAGWILAAFRLDVNRFRGRESLQLVIDYLAPA